MVLTYQPLSETISLTLPRYASIKQALDFAHDKRDWLEQEIARHADKIRFEVGADIPVLGQTLRVAHSAGRGLVRAEGGRLVVPGDPDFTARRVRDWLKKRMKETTTQLAQEKAQQLGVQVKKITLRDTRSQWGSCSTDGQLVFSWRLVFAPREVLDYVVCHEVAHLVEMNHSKAFWAQVERICPRWEHARWWLKRHGETLYRYG